MLAAPTYVTTSCGVVYTDSDYWTDQEKTELGSILEALCEDN